MKNGGMLHAHCESYMNRHLIKRLVVTVVSFVLLYYSTAWAVLRCFHEAYDSDHEIEILYDASAQMNFECIGPDYHLETMAGSSAPTQLHRLIADFTPHVNDVLILRSLSDNRESDVWLRAVFERLSPSAFLIPIPLYLSISVLRF
jgi:hypothetical protein